MVSCMRKQTTTVKVLKNLVDEAHNCGYNVSCVCNESLKEAIAIYKAGKQQVDKDDA
jgi:hypothetical protein